VSLMYVICVYVGVVCCACMCFASAFGLFVECVLLCVCCIFECGG